MADPSAGRVSLHPCFHNGLWTASSEITGEGGTPALFCFHQKQKEGNEMDKEKLNGTLANGKAGAQAAYAKGNELMDKVGFLKSPLHKKIAWGVLCLLALLMVGRIFGCGGSSDEKLIINGCKAYIEQRYGENSLKKFEVVEVTVNENRAILKADVKIHDEGSIAPVRDPLTICSRTRTSNASRRWGHSEFTSMSAI